MIERVRQSEQDAANKSDLHIEEQQTKWLEVLEMNLLGYIRYSGVDNLDRPEENMLDKILNVNPADDRA